MSLREMHELLVSDDGKQIFVMGHLEYDRLTLDYEYKRDSKKGLNPDLPENYYPDDDSSPADPAPVRVHGYGPVPDPLHTQPFAPAAQGPGNVEGAVRLGKHPVAPLGFQGDAQLLKKGHGVPAVEPGEGPVQKPPVPGDPPSRGCP